MKKLSTKTLCLFLLFIMSIFTTKTSAHDIEVENADGVTIYYEFINNYTELEVSYRYDGIYSYSNEYYGNVVIPESVTFYGDIFRVTSIGSHAFEDCTGLTSVTIPNSVISIGSSAFDGCTSLVSVTIPNSVTNIGSSAFDGTPWYNNQPDGVIYAGKVAYEYKGFMPTGTSIVLEEGIVSITDYAFVNCSGLISVSIPESVTSIGDGAFQCCYGLTSVTIPNSVTNIGWWAFYETAWFDNQPDGVVYAGKVAYQYKGIMPTGTSIIIKEGIVSITDYAFKDCTGLLSIDIPNSVTSIGSSAFYGCTGLTRVSIPRSITTIKRHAFENCTGLKKVIISDIAAWCGISSDDNPNIVIEPEANPLYYAKHIFSDEDTEITELVIPEGVSSIWYNAFINCSSLTSVTIPSSLKNINRDAFFGCTGLKKVIVPDIAAWCDIPSFFINKYENTYNNPLYYAKHLYSDENTEITELFIPTNVKRISYSTFINCESIKSIVFPNGINEIGANAFQGCSNLEKIVIPNSLKRIGDNSFSDCLNLYSVTSLINMPFNLDESVFQYTGYDYDENIIYMAATLYVPRGRTAMYSNIQGWKNFLSIMETDTKFNLTYMVDGEVYKTYEIQATEVITPEPDPYKEGYIFSGWSEIPYLMPAENVTITGSFTKDQSTGIEETNNNETTTMTYYSVNGHQINNPQKGLNIIRMSDGTTKKVVVK